MLNHRISCLQVAPLPLSSCVQGLAKQTVYPCMRTSITNLQHVNLLAAGPGADLAAARTAPPTERLLARRLYASPMASMGTTPSVSAPNAAAARSLRDRLRSLQHLSSTP